MNKLLIVDDSLPFLSDVEALLGDYYAVVTANTGKRALELLKSDQIAAVLLDLMLPDVNGQELLQIIRRDIDPHLPVIIITDHADVENAVMAMRNGAYDFLNKNFNRAILSEKISKALERRQLEISVQALQGTFAEMHDHFVFASDAMKRLNAEINRLASVNFDVLITGETGVGKDLAAFEIHRRSLRASRPFIQLAVKSLSETLIESELFGHERGAFSGADRAKIGKLEAAEGGTLYIPEVSSLNETTQLKLLQFMQYKTVTKVGQDPRKPERKVDVRIILATNEILESAVHDGRMRADFFHRISGVRLPIPPLRERVDDIEPLARYFLDKHAPALTNEIPSLGGDAVSALKRYPWPGNIRELENWIKNALTYSPKTVLQVSDFPFLEDSHHRNDQSNAWMAVRNEKLPSFIEAEKEFRRVYLREALKQSENNIPRAAELVGLTPQGLRRIIRALGLKSSEASKY